MAWSKWRGALVVISLTSVSLASVGLVWSQSTRQTIASERIMTVREDNGKALRCRVLQSWRTSSGAMAYQLQALETGEILTIVEDGQPTMVPSSSGGVARALPMRIFHWGQRGAAPMGSPQPPTTVEPALASVPASSRVVPASAQSVVTPVPAPVARLTKSSSTCECATPAPCAVPCNTGCTDTKERVITWDEGSSRSLGKRSGPVIVENNRPTGPTIVEGDAAGLGKIDTAQLEPPLPQPLLQHPAAPAKETVVITEGKATRGDAANLVPVPPLPGASAADASASLPGVPMPGGLMNAGGPAPAESSKDLTLTAGSSTPGAPTVLPASATSENTTANGAGAGDGKTDEKSPTTFREKLGSFFHKQPSAKSGEAKTIDGKTTDAKSAPTTLPQAASPAMAQAAPAPAKNDLKPPLLPAAGKEERRPFSTATAPAAITPTKVNGPVITTGPDANTQQVSGSGNPKDSTPAREPSLTTVPSPALTPASQEYIKPGVAKRDGPDWRKMWGKGGENKIDQPGQTTVAREKIRSEVPPASASEGKKQDILMAPERFNPAGEKVNPNVTPEMTGLAPPPAYVPQAAGAPLPQAMPQAMPQALPTPLGVQSVLAARNGVQGPVQYIPVPVATVPEPIRPPTPPEPNLPQPPNPTMYVNAFTPPLPPQGQNPGQNAMQPMLPPAMMPQGMMPQQAMMPQGMPQGMMPQGMAPQGMAPQGMVPQGMMPQAMPQAPAGFVPPQTAQLVPIGNGMPMQVTYPASYTGPLPPNPVPSQAPAAVQPAAFNPAINGNVPMNRQPTQGAAAAAGGEAINLNQLISVLQESPYPAQREWAAANLATFDWRVYPHLPQVLVQAARQDAVPTVRAAAVYSLSRMNLQSEPVMSTLQALRGDADPRVRQEVEQAFVRMGVRPAQ